MYFFDRQAEPDRPGGVTVSRTAKLPEGDFGITEYCWGSVSLWFIDSHRFSASERQAAYEHEDTND